MRTVAVCATLLLGCGGAPFAQGITPVGDAAPDAVGSDDGGVHADGGGDAIGIGRDSGGDDGGLVDAGPPPAPPPGWSLVESSWSKGAVCGSDWAGGASTLHDGLQADPAACGCACDAPTGVTCDATLDYWACNHQFGTDPATSGQCLGASAVGTPIDTLTAKGGSCAANATTTVPPIGWTNDVTTCGASATIGSVDPSFRACAKRDGDVACPADWPDKFIESTGADDTRGCSACSCGSPSVACGGVVNYYSDGACGTFVNSVAAPTSACVGIAGSAKWIASPSGSCPPSPVTPTGDASPTGAVTLCCR
jgi:hypothetical protein